MPAEESGVSSRDLGYLTQFLATLAAHAATSPDELDARSVRLVAEEVER